MRAQTKVVHLNMYVCLEFTSNYIHVLVRFYIKSIVYIIIYIYTGVPGNIYIYGGTG